MYIQWLDMAFLTVRLTFLWLAMSLSLPMVIETRTPDTAPFPDQFQSFLSYQCYNCTLICFSGLEPTCLSLTPSPTWLVSF